MATVYQTDNRSGITYAYESVSRWDKVKKQSRSTRTLIGRVDAETGEIIPTDGRMKGASNSKEKTFKGKAFQAAPICQAVLWGDISV